METRNGRGLLWLVAGLLLLEGLLLGWIARREAARPPEVMYLAARFDLPEGQRLTYARLTLLPAEDSRSLRLPAGALIPASDADGYIGTVTKRPIEFGELVLASDLAPWKPKDGPRLAEAIAKGFRAMGVPGTSLSAVSDSLAPGDFCEILVHIDATPSIEARQAFAKMGFDPGEVQAGQRVAVRLPEPVKVLVASDPPAGGPSEDAPETIALIGADKKAVRHGDLVLELTPEEASIIGFAVFAGSLSEDHAPSLTLTRTEPPAGRSRENATPDAAKSVRVAEESF